MQDNKTHDHIQYRYHKLTFFLSTKQPLEYQDKLEVTLASRRKKMNELFKERFQHPHKPADPKMPTQLLLKKLFILDKYAIGTQVTRKELGYKFSNGYSDRDFRTSDHPSLTSIPVLFIKNIEQNEQTDIILLRDILSDLEEEGRDLVGQVTEMDPLAVENKGKSSGAAGIPNNKRLQQSITGSGVITLGAHNAKNLNFAKISGKSARLNYCNASGETKEFQLGVSLKRMIYEKKKTINLFS